MARMYNLHTHVFTSRAVPNGLLPFGLVRFLRCRPGGRIARWILENLRPFKNDDRYDRYAAFASIGNLASQQEIYERLLGFYPQSSGYGLGPTGFGVLAMDMDYMGAGSAPQPYLAQLEELRTLSSKHSATLLAFLAVDPRRPRVLDLVQAHIDTHGFTGIKLYPPLGYWPFDSDLDPVYAYAEERGVPIITHCSRGGVYYKGEITDDMRRNPKDPAMTLPSDRKRLFQRYSDPSNYEYVLAKYPRLKLCLAHYGGAAEWRRHLSDPWQANAQRSWVSAINSLIREHEGVFADVSSVAADPGTHGLIKVLLEDSKIGSRILFGSDYYMVRRKVTEKEFSINLRGYVGEANFAKAAVANPVAFLS